MEDATVASSPPRESASTGDAVASPHRSADHAGRRVEGDNVGARREMEGARDEPTPKPVKVSETATRLRVSEATVEALEEALAAKARALAEAATREAKLRTDLDAARLGLVTSSAGDVPGDDVPAAPAAADPSAHPALREWRDRARAAESARDDAERRAARLASENAALVSMLERYRGVDPNTVDDPDPTNPPASVRDEMRVAVAEGELASCRARLRAAETALDDWRAHAASLSDRLAVAEASAAARRDPTPDSPSPTSRRSRGGSTRRSDSPPPPSPPPRKSLRRPSRAVVARRRTTRVWNSHGDTSSAPDAHEAPPSPPKDGHRRREDGSAVTKSASARATCDANVALAEALAAARRVSETAERRLAAGAEALRRAAALETSASRRLASKPAAVAVVDVRAAVESIERAVAEAE